MELGSGSGVRVPFLTVLVKSDIKRLCVKMHYRLRQRLRVSLSVKRKTYKHKVTYHTCQVVFVGQVKDFTGGDAVTGNICLHSVFLSSHDLDKGVV